jgi:hypothetical protein
VRIRLFLAAVCIITFPVLFPIFQDSKSSVSAPFSTVVLAGRTMVGGVWCQCGCAECICDPGETPSDCVGGQGLNRVSDKNQRSDQATSPITNPGSGIDFGSGALLLALTFFLWSRLRAY